MELTFEDSSKSRIFYLNDNTDGKFPYWRQQYYFYTNTFDLKMASPNNIFKRQQMQDYIIKNFKNKGKLLIIDMTGNIGCDAVNFSILSNAIVFTCEYEQSKAISLQLNTLNYDNIYTFVADSNELLNAILNKNTENIKKIKNMSTLSDDYKIQSHGCIETDDKELSSSTFKNYNKLKIKIENIINSQPDIIHSKHKKLNNILNNIDQYEIIINIDPPFGENYKFEKEKGKSTNLIFCGVDIIDYFKKIEKKNVNNKIIKYIIKAPMNWDKLEDIRKDKDIATTIEMKTKKSGFYYCIIDPKFMHEDSITSGGGYTEFKYKDKELNNNIMMAIILAIIIIVIVIIIVIKIYSFNFSYLISSKNKIK